MRLRSISMWRPGDDVIELTADASFRNPVRLCLHILDHRRTQSSLPILLDKRDSRKLTLIERSCFTRLHRTF